MRIQGFELKEGELVVGTHYTLLKINVIAGTIIKIMKSKNEKIIKVKGDRFVRLHYESLDFSGELLESEVEVIDQEKCKEIINLFEFANKQLSNGQPCLDTAEKISTLRHNNRLKLEEIYGIKEN